MPSKNKFLFFLFFIFVFSGAIAGEEIIPTGVKDSLPDDTVVVKQLIITGNKITKLQIITRELMFHEKDTLPSFAFEKAVERSRENLMNTGIFNFVNITYEKSDSVNAIVIVDVTERWYIFPVPIFELVDRNFNEWVKSGDWSRINYGFYLNWDNFRGMNESLKFQFRWGYSQRIGLSYSIPFINKNQDEGLSFNVAYSRNREVGYDVKDSKQQLYQEEDGFVRKEYSGSITYSRRKGHYNSSNFTVEYRNNHVADTVIALNPYYLEYQRNSQQLIVVAWRFRRDMRDYKVYPLKGYLFDFDAVKNGTGLLENEPNLMFLQTQFKYFHQIAPRWYGASTLKGKVSGQTDAPYFNQRGFGFNNDFIRGYEYYVVPGQNFVLSRNSLKFALVPTQVITLPFSILEKFRTIPFAFYLNANFDAGYVNDRQFEQKNPLANKWQYGYGLGIDYVTYYNLVFRVEYSFNKFGENGFYLHFTAPI